MAAIVNENMILPICHDSPGVPREQFAPFSIIIGPTGHPFNTFGSSILCVIRGGTRCGLKKVFWPNTNTRATAEACSNRSEEGYCLQQAKCDHCRHSGRPIEGKYLPELMWGKCWNCWNGAEWGFEERR